MLKKVGLITAAILVIFQFIPVDRTNPPIKNEPKWNSHATREMVKNSCFDCHSNEATYPWYSYVAPVSWLVSNHIAEGREHLNFSEWTNDVDVDEMIEEIRSGEMPLWDYKLMHSHANLTPEQTDSLVAGLKRTFILDATDSEE
jgi:hypothetical protein